MMQDKIIIDTDPGIDDALALVFGNCAGLPIEAITTVYGNSTIDNVTRTSGYILKSINDNTWEIFKGAERPLSGEGLLAESHGTAGLGSLQPKKSEVQPSESSTANEYLVRTLTTTNNNVLFCLGPLTNLAVAIQNSPGLLQKVRKLIIMGGAFSQRGNVTDFAEFNIYHDPKAASFVFDMAHRQDIDTVIIPAEVCREVLLTKDDLASLQAANLLPNLKSIVEPFVNYYMNDGLHGGYAGAVLYDVLVPVYYLRPELFKSIPANISVDLYDPARRGKTSLISEPSSSIKVCTTVNGAKAKAFVMRTLLEFRS
jgi:purine nucleosidase